MKYPKLFLLAILILPWLTIPLLGKKTIKRFWLASFFMSFVVWIESLIARRYRWWMFYEKLHSKVLGELPLIVGPFFIGTLWILKFAYGKIVRFTIINLIVDSFFTYILVEWFQKSKIATLFRLNKIQLSLLFFVKSMLLYGFQAFIKK